eukprot:SAG31_NODE_820_length_11808_cov_16.331540_10_plen_97_part_00
MASSGCRLESTWSELQMLQGKGMSTASGALGDAIDVGQHLSEVHEIQEDNVIALSCVGGYLALTFGPEVLEKTSMCWPRTVRKIWQVKFLVFGTTI